jgi:hypothetical protein
MQYAYLGSITPYATYRSPKLAVWRLHDAILIGNLGVDNLTLARGALKPAGIDAPYGGFTIRSCDDTHSIFAGR